MGKLRLIINKENKQVYINNVMYFDYQRDNIIAKTEFCTYEIDLYDVDNVSISVCDCVCDICKHTDKTSDEEPCSSCLHNSTDNWEAQV